MTFENGMIPIPILQSMMVPLKNRMASEILTSLVMVVLAIITWNNGPVMAPTEYEQIELESQHDDEFARQSA